MSTEYLVTKYKLGEHISNIVEDLMGDEESENAVDEYWRVLVTIDFMKKHVNHGGNHPRPN